jgi:RND family efflux transporter MFP subunit
VLETLVTVSREITSTLNLDRMLQTIVNAAHAVIPYERAAIALDRGGRIKIGAVTGSTTVNADAPEIAPLNEVMQWAALAGEILHVTQHDGTVDAERPETRAKFEKYFRATGMRAFYALPLNDDSGRVGILVLESSDPDFLSTTHKEILQVLAGQTTVALRNAQMYKEVPFISVLEPILNRKRRFMAMGKGRRVGTVALALAVLAFLILFPLPLRVDGDAVVAPVHRAKVQPEVEGVISKILVHEGDRVEKGQVLAEMNAWQYRASLAGAEAGYRTAQLQMNRALASNNGTEAGMQRVQADYWNSEVERARGLLEKTQLRSPISGTVATPHIENLVGRKLELGDSFAEVVDVSEVIVDVAVDDADAGLVQQGQSTVLKMNSNALRTFGGNVVVVSPHAVAQDGSSVFYARVAVRNDDRSLRAGMEGRGKVSVGWYPSGYVFFRRPAIWIYSQIWSWIGW